METTVASPILNTPTTENEKEAQKTTNSLNSNVFEENSSNDIIEKQVPKQTTDSISMFSLKETTAVKNETKTQVNI